MPQGAGEVNRDFDEVTAEGAITCYDSLRTISLPPEETLPFVILLQLTSETTLRVERQDADSCDEKPWTFVSEYVDFER